MPNFPKTCSVCKRKLSRYNSNKKCWFHYEDPERMSDSQRMRINSLNGSDKGQKIFVPDIDLDWLVN